MPISLKVELKDGFYKKIQANYPELIDETLVKTAIEAEGIAKKEAPVRTGTLRRSIHFCHPSFMTSGLSVEEAAYYWIYIQFGTRKMSANPFITRTANQIISKELFTTNLKELLHEKGII